MRASTPTLDSLARSCKKSGGSVANVLKVLDGHEQKPSLPNSVAQKTSQCGSAPSCGQALAQPEANSESQLRNKRQSLILLLGLPSPKSYVPISKDEYLE